MVISKSPYEPDLENPTRLENSNSNPKLDSLTSAKVKVDEKDQEKG